MAVNTMMDLATDNWTQVTNANATSITIIHRGGGSEVIVQAVVGATPPAADDIRGLPITTGKDRHQSGFLKKSLADLTHTASPTRVYARAIGMQATVYVETD
jgi:hypothetical protein